MLKEIKRLWRSDSLLDEAWEQTFKMLEIDEEMFLEATRSLRESDDAEVNLEVRKKDKQVNAFERDVRRKVMTHCALQGPTQLPGGLVLVSIIIDMERIGDYTKNIFDLAINHPKRLHGGILEEDLARVETAVKDVFVRCRACLRESDEAAALELLSEYDWIGRVCEDCVMSLVREEDSGIGTGDAVSLALYLRWLKRVNSHLRNVVSSVVNPFDRIGFKPKKQ